MTEINRTKQDPEPCCMRGEERTSDKPTFPWM
jgi:hypothetical protein